MTLKKSLLTIAMTVRVGSPIAVTERMPPRNLAMPTNDRLRSRKSLKFGSDRAE